MHKGNLGITQVFNERITSKCVWKLTGFQINLVVWQKSWDITKLGGKVIKQGYLV